MEEPGLGSNDAIDRSRSPRRSWQEPEPGDSQNGDRAVFSFADYQAEVFKKFGRCSSVAFVSKFQEFVPDQVDDEVVCFKDQVRDIHESVSKLIEKHAPAFDARYDELVIWKTTVWQFERGGERSHDVFLVRVFATLFSGPVSPWRAHDWQPYRYSNGAWILVMTMGIDQVLRIEEALNAADALLKRMSRHKDYPRPCWSEDWLVADSKPGGTDKSAQEVDEAWGLCRKLLRDTLTKLMQNGGQLIVRNFCRFCNEPKKAEPLLAFIDICFKLEPGKPAVKVKKSPAANCYASFPMKLTFKPPVADVERYDLLMGTLYGSDAEGRELEICGEARALVHLRQPPRCRLRKGKGFRLASQNLAGLVGSSSLGLTV